jgi:hypothetical protein
MFFFLTILHFFSDFIAINYSYNLPLTNCCDSDGFVSSFYAWRTNIYNSPIVWFVYRNTLIWLLRQNISRILCKFGQNKTFCQRVFKNKEMGGVASIFIFRTLLIPYSLNYNFWYFKLK